MKRQLLLLVCLLVVFITTSEAHRLNEYLRATTLSLTRDSVKLQLHLTPGSEIAPGVLTIIDANGDHILSDAEQRVYSDWILQKLSLRIDNTEVSLVLLEIKFPDRNEIAEGRGDILLSIAARMPNDRGEHHLILSNRDPQAHDIYMVNCLIPSDTTISIISQARNVDQSVYELDFTTERSATGGLSQRTFEKEERVAAIETYFPRGVKHILTGYDHLLFLCALVLGAVGLWDLIKVVTAFTIAHSITLMLAALGYAHLSAHIVEPLISASIIIVALQNIFWPKYATGIGRLAVAFVFGLVHGLGFAGALLELMQNSSPALIGYVILGFSLGVEIGNQLVLLPLYFGYQYIKKIQPGSEKPVVFNFSRLASGIVAIFGFYYFAISLIS